MIAADPRFAGEVAGRGARATGVLVLAPILAAVSASCSGVPSPPPAEPPPRCRTAIVRAAPPPATGSAAPSAPAVPVAPALPVAPAFELDKPASRQKLTLTRRTSKRASQSSYALVPRGSGGAWLLPANAGRGEQIFTIDAAGSVKEAWSASAQVTLLGARGGADGLIVAGMPGATGTFGFARLERVFQLSPDGRTTGDHAFQAGVVRPRAVGSDAAGNLLVAGTLAGPLTAGKTTLVPDAGGRAEVLLSIGPDGKAEWVTALENTSGEIAALAAAPDGSALVVSSPALGEQELTAFGPGGTLAWKKHLSSTPPARFPTPAVDAIAADGKGGFLAKGPLSSEGGLDFGLGPLTGAGYFVVRLDGKGQGVWERSFAEDRRISSDGAGSLLVVERHPSDGGLHAHEIDSEGRVVRAVDIDVPTDCRPTNHPVFVEATGGITPAAIFVLVTCQVEDDGYRPEIPIGKPAIYTGSLARK